jgi:hypothetical protein
MADSENPRLCRNVFVALLAIVGRRAAKAAAPQRNQGVLIVIAFSPSASVAASPVTPLPSASAQSRVCCMRRSWLTTARMAIIRQIALRHERIEDGIDLVARGAVANSFHSSAREYRAGQITDGAAERPRCGHRRVDARRFARKLCGLLLGARLAAPPQGPARRPRRGSASSSAAFRMLAQKFARIVLALTDLFAVIRVPRAIVDDVVGDAELDDRLRGKCLPVENSTAPREKAGPPCS